MAVKTYGRTSLIGGATGALDEYDADNLSEGDRALTITTTLEYYYHRLNATSGAAESSPDVIKPDSGGGVSPYAGTKRWILVSYGTVTLADTDGSHHLELKWNENDTANRVLNLLVAGGDRSLTLNESLVIGDGNDGTITFTGASKTLSVEDDSVVNQDLTTDAGVTFAAITGNGVLTVKPDGTNEVLQVNDGSLDLSDGNAGTAGTATIDASGNLSYNKNISAVDLDGIIGSNTPAAGSFTTLGASGDVNVTGNLISAAGVIIDYVSVNDAARTNTTLSTDHIVGFIALTATRNYQISSEDIAQAGRVFIVKDEVGKAATFPITISTEGAETIDGAATISISSNYGAVYLYSNGSNLFIY